MKINFHHLQKCASCGLFCPDFMPIWRRECKLPHRDFCCLSCSICWVFSFGVKLWSLMKLKLSGLGLLLSWGACPLQVLCCLFFLRLLSVFSCLCIFPPASFYWAFGDLKRSWGSFWHGRKWDNHRKEMLSQSSPRQLWARSAVIFRALIPPGTWRYLYKKSVYNLYPYMAEGFQTIKVTKCWFLSVF